MPASTSYLPALIPAEFPAAAVPAAITASRRETLQLIPKPTQAAQRLLGPALAILIWFVVTAAGWVSPETLPKPGTVATTFNELWAGGYLAANIGSSLQRAGEGLAAGIIAGVLLALVAGLTRWGDALLDGLVQIKRALPNLALIPLFIMWMGIGEAMKVTVITLGVFVPIYINTHAALRDIDLRYVELAQTVGLNRRRFLRYIVFPSCLPGFFTGLRLAATHAWTALVVVETINATSGIGYMISQARIYGQIEIVIAGLVLYGVLGFGTDALIRALHKKVLVWRQTIA